mgnify:CR=1 FL=1
MRKRFWIALLLCALTLTASPACAADAVVEDPIADGYLEILIEVMQGADPQKILSLMPYVQGENPSEGLKTLQRVWEPGPCTWRAVSSASQPIAYNDRPATLYAQSY